MIKTFIAYTDEIDDIALAVETICTQLSDCSGGNDHTLGILVCHPEFVHSGVTAAVVAALPFPVVGMSTQCMGVGPLPESDVDLGEGALRLTMLVFQGERVRYEIVRSGKLPDDIEMTTLTHRMLADRDTPGMLLAFTPDYSTLSCAALCQAVSETMPGVPLFGGVGVDDSPLYNEDCFVITPDGPLKNELVMVLVHDKEVPRFFTASVPPERVMNGTWRVTDAEEAWLRAVDKHPVTEFLAGFGLTRSLAQDGALTGLSLLVKEPNKPPYSRTMLSLNAEGDLLCGGGMPRESEIRLARFEKSAMLLAARTLLEEAFDESREPVALLVWCCATRAAVLGDDALAEIHLLRQAAKDIPFLLAYAGGEICPGIGDDGQLYNQFHNQSFTMCVLYKS
ncbi:MAG: FIST C-terminal domain-containing protein [Clostridium sp.]|jgi:hypothetical protein|nr:FIST C-terminal domain-containing protein [Clostridium sp.]